MSGGVIAGAIAPHTPRIGIEAGAPPFARGLIEGLRDLGAALRAQQPDVIVLHSSHWVSTFNWYVTAHERHRGTCIADEAPDLIPGVPYDRPGEPAFARALAERLQQAGVPCGINDSPHFDWDYGSLVPLQYMDPDATVPVVLLPAVICSELDECRTVGATVHALARDTGQRVAFVASCALSHQVLRGPERWPTEERQELDRRFMALVEGARVAELADWAPTYCRDAVAEMGGRPISSMIGALQAMAGEGGDLEGHQYGPYAQSSGSGNACLAILRRAA